jgi:hypothetical protein
MSNSGKLTPLQLNVASGLQQSTGLIINPVATGYQGQWPVSPGNLGTIVSDTVLNQLTQALPKAYANLGNIDPATYQSLISIGQSVCPALGNSKPATFVKTYKGSYVASWPYGVNEEYEPAVDNSYLSTGFISTIARQAYYEMWSAATQYRYNSIVRAFSQFDSWRASQNKPIASYVNAQSFDSGLFSNINDTTTNNLSGVSQCFRIWGQDMVNLGRALDLSNIWRWGTPSVLLKTLQNNNAVTSAVVLAMSYAGIAESDISRIFQPGYIPTAAQERKIYEAFKLVQGNDLLSLTDGIVYLLNCKTTGLNSLADLLDPRKIFPNSYNSLTVPQYRPDLVNGKVYYFIYSKDGINQSVASLPGVAERYAELALMLPQEQAIACAAFAVSMQQVTNVVNSDIEKLSLAIVDLELPDLDLPLVNTATGTPLNLSLADSMLTALALGSGNGGSYRQCDFWGAAAGYPYTDYYSNIQRLLKLLSVSSLQSTYQAINNLDFTDPGADSQLQVLIATANNQILSIKNSSTAIVGQINYYWDLIGTQMTIEQRAITTAMPVLSTVLYEPVPYDFITFAQSIQTWAQDNGQGEAGYVLAEISDKTTVTGQCLISSLREARNANRLAKAGVEPSNDVEDNLDLCGASAKAVLTNGVITGITVTSPGSGYTVTSPPRVSVYPVGYGAKLQPVISSAGTIVELTILNPGKNMPNAQIVIESPPPCQPNLYQKAPASWPPEPSFTSNKNVPDLSAIQPSDSASPTVDQAIESVTLCNCDCWNL